MPVQTTSWRILWPDCLSVCRMMQSRSPPPTSDSPLLSLLVVAGANVYRLQRDSGWVLAGGSVSSGDLGFVTTRHYPDSAKGHLNATCVQDLCFVNFQPPGLKGGSTTASRLPPNRICSLWDSRLSGFQCSTHNSN